MYDGKYLEGRERMTDKETDNCRIIMEWQVEVLTVKKQ